MANRPLFDDEQLPTWLTNAGITHGSGGEESPLSPGWQSDAAPEAPASTSSDLSWMDSAWESGASTVEPPAEVEGGSLPWYSGDSAQDNTFSAPVSTGDTPWMSDVDSSASSPATGGWSPVESGSADTFELSSPAPFGEADALPWMTDVGTSQASQESAPSADAWTHGDFGSEESAPTISTPTPAQTRPGLTGMLPWRQGTSEPDDQPQSSPVSDSDLNDLSWMNEPEPTPESSVPETNVSGMDWMQDVGSSSPVEQAVPAASFAEPEAAAPDEIGSNWFQDLDVQDNAPVEATPAPEPVSDADWMQDLQSHLDTPVEEPPPPAPPVEPPKPMGMIKRLAAQPMPPPITPSEPATAETQAPPTIKKLSATPPAETPAQPSIKKLPTQPLPAGDASAQKPPTGTIKKLSSADAPAQPSQGSIKKLPTKPLPAQKPPPDMSNMTYEEWERSQIEQEQEAQADPGDKLLEEIPDWFASGGPSMTNAPAADQNAQGGADLMPEWFLGMEEKSDAPVPNWFNNMDLSATSLVGPETVQTPSTQPPIDNMPTPDAPSDDDVPDWFKGESPVGTLDFNSMFVTPTESDTATPSSKPKVASLLPRDAEPVVAPPAESDVPDNDLDWMSGMPDFGNAVDADDTLPPAIPTEPSAPADDLEWMNAMPDFGEAVTEVPTPPPMPKPASQPSMSTFPTESEAALPVADDLLSDLDWLNEPVSRTPSDAQVTTASTLPDQTMETDPAEEPDALNEILDSLDWMGSEPAQPEAAAPPPEDDVPEWMREMAPSELRPVVPVTPESTPGRLDQDDAWLTGVDFSESPVEMSSVDVGSPAVASSEPKPYSEMPPELAEKIANLDLEQKVGSSDIDSLLHLSSAESLAITRADQPPSAVMAPQQNLDLDFESNELDTILGAPEEPGMPDFALDAAADVDDVLGLATDSGSASPTGEQSRPKRLTRLTSAPQEATTSDQMSVEGQPQEALPDWVENLKPTEGPVVIRVGDQQVRMQEEPLGKVPAGVRRIREQSKAFRERKVPTTAPDSGPLSGIESAIPIVAVKPGALVTGATSELNELHTRRVKIIQGILEQEDRLLKDRKLSEDEREQQAASKATTRPKLRIKVDRLLITLVLALAVIAPFFTDALNLAAVPDMTNLTVAQDSVAKQVDALQPDQPVLVAFEYGPTGAGELDILARAAILDILKHKAHPIIVSTNPSGVMHAQALMAIMSIDPDDLKIMGRDATHPLIARQDYVVLRYLPGGATGVRSLVNAIIGGGFQSQVALSTDSEGQPVDTAVLKLVDLRSSPAFILAESPEDVRNWVEQFRPGSTDKPLGMVFLSSAAASAAAQAYASGAANIFGPLVGLRDAVSYQQVRGLSDLTTKADAQRWQSVGLAGLLAVVVILFSSAINLIRSLRKRETR